jgi:hypothetical protein
MTRLRISMVVGALSGLAVALAFNLLPYARSYQNYRHDDYEVIGWPFLFWRGGGFSYRQEFHPALLLADAIIGLAFAAAWGVAAAKLPQAFRRSARGFPILPPSDGGAAAE